MTVRKGSVFPLLFFLLILLQPGLLFGQSPCTEKKVIGQESWVHIQELGLDFLARVDTGATTTSLHATNFLIIDGTDNPYENIGKAINFRTVSTVGEHKSLTAEIVKIQTVVNAQGREKRYMVWLTLAARGVSKTILINLRDRSRMRYKLLMGRDWLADDFLVDVNLDEDIVAVEGEEE